MTPLQRLGANIRNERKRLGLTIVGLANRSNVLADHIGLAEAGNIKLFPAEVRSLAFAMNLPLQCLNEGRAS